MRNGINIIAVVIILNVTTTVLAAPPALLEMTEQGTTYRGKLVARDKHSCWLMAQDGRLNELRLDQVEHFKRVDKRFRRFSAAKIRDQLRREFGKGYEIVGTAHYLVCASRGRASQYASIFEDLYRAFYLYFSVRGVTMTKPEFPLVAVVFPDRRKFADYGRQDGLNASVGLLGYYLAKSNRIALFDSEPNSTSATLPRPATWNTQGALADILLRFHSDAGRVPWATFCRPFGAFQTPAHTANEPVMLLTTDISSRRLMHANMGWAGSIKGSLKDTLIHEATHQVAFNTGLHSRIGKNANPVWVVEGLATVFEAPGIRNGSRRMPIQTRLNRERFVRFGRFVERRRKPKSLAAFVSSDSMFHSATLDAYSQAWALSFYLIETRPSKYVSYLKSIAARDPLKGYTSKQRLADFQQAFGTDLDRLEVDFLRFLTRLQ